VRNYFSTHKKQYEEQAEKLKTNRLSTDVPGSTLLFGAMKTTNRAEIMSSLPSKYTTDILVARYFNSYDPSTSKSAAHRRGLHLYVMILTQK
jgi:hypothetical protein